MPSVKMKANKPARGCPMLATICPRTYPHTCGDCDDDCCKKDTSYVPDLGFTYEEVTTEKFTVLGASRFEDGSNNIKEIETKTLHFRKNGNCILRREYTRIVDGITTNRPVEITCDRYTQYDLGGDGEYEIKFTNMEFREHKKIKNKLGNNLLHSNAEIDDIAGTLEYETGATVTITSPGVINFVDFDSGYQREITIQTFKRVYNKEYLFNNLCGGTPPIELAPMPETLPPSTSGGGGCSIM
jgi:hypothetical protein